MITYICHNKNKETGEDLPCTNSICETSICPVCGNRTESISTIFWCHECQIPLYEEQCGICKKRGKKICTDIRPVFPEERLLLEIILDKPFSFLEASVWNGSGNRYYVNGEKISFSVRSLKKMDSVQIRRNYEELKVRNNDKNFEKYKKRFIQANTAHYKKIVEEANSFIRSSAREFEIMDMFVSFSGGKDSTVTSDLVTRALSNPKIMHIFGDTTLEMPYTYEYVKRFKQKHPKTPLISARNKEKDFKTLCKLVGPPSRVMRWCCTVFKTGTIQKRIKSLYRDKKQILTFYGIRRSESANRSKYEREAESPKITKQRIVSPIIDWMDFDVWLYLLTTGIDFNEAYRLGYARVGCWCCPNNSSWSEFLARIHMYEQAKEFRQFLVEFAMSIGKEDAQRYVDEGGWKARQGGNGIAYAQKSIVAFQPCALEENAFNYELQRPVSLELYELFKPFGQLDFQMGNSRLGEVYVLNPQGKILLKIQGRMNSSQLKVTVVNLPLTGAKDIKTAEERIKCQLTKYQMCMGCLACESVCKYNALLVKEKKDGTIEYHIAEDKCVRCGACINHFTAGCYMRKVLTIKRT